MDWFDTILWPIKIVVAWIMVGFHGLFTWLGLDPAGGAAWALSIVGLVIVMRILLIPLFVKQIKASRGLQLISPELQAIQKKYKGKSDPASREAMSRETMELYRKHGTNPFSSCLPILAQSPIFFALFRVLYNLPAVADGTYPRDAIGPITRDVAAQATQAEIFGAPISSWFLQDGASAATRVVTLVLIVAMSVTTFTTQRQLTQKNMPASALEGPMAQQQKMLLYVLPLVFAVSGVNFPIGVLIYWTTTNLWSMGQQFYVIRRNPTPGSEAERLLKERRARKAAAKGIVLEEDKPAVEDLRPKGQRQQPKRKDRAKGGSRPAVGEPGSGEGASEGGDAGGTGAGGTAGGTARGAAGGTGSAARPKRPAGSAKPRPAGGEAGAAAATKGAAGAKRPAGPAGGSAAGGSAAGGTGRAAGRAAGAGTGGATPTAEPAATAGRAAPAEATTTAEATTDSSTSSAPAGSGGTSRARTSSAAPRTRAPRKPRSTAGAPTPPASNPAVAGEPASSPSGDADSAPGAAGSDSVPPARPARAPRTRPATSATPDQETPDAQR